MSNYTSLRLSATQAPLSYGVKAEDTEKLNWNEPATLVIDDFTKVNPLHVHTSTMLKFADAIMDGAGVRYTCVLNAADTLVGILTQRDLHGRKSVRAAHELQVPHDELHVEYLMKPLANLPVVTRKQLDHAKIGDVVATLQKSGHEFLLIQDEGVVVGLVSSLTIVERTGESVQVRHHAESFAEILYAIKHSEDLE